VEVSVSRMTRNDARHLARQTAAQVRPVAAQTAAQVKPVAAQVTAQVKPVAAQLTAQVKPVAAQLTAQVKPVAKSAGAATRRGIYRTRAWAAPRVERSGQLLEDTVAPKVSALLSEAAQRIEPVKPRRGRLRKVIGLSLLAAAAASAAAAALRRAKPDLWARPSRPAADETAATADRPAAHPPTGSDAEVNSQLHTP
jgi:hypothetical protein